MVCALFYRWRSMRKRSLYWLTSYVITPKPRTTARRTQKEKAESIGRISTRLYLEFTYSLRIGKWVDTGVGSSSPLSISLPLAYCVAPSPFASVSLHLSPSLSL